TPPSPDSPPRSVPRPRALPLTSQPRRAKQDTRAWHNLVGCISAAQCTRIVGRRQTPKSGGLLVGLHCQGQTSTRPIQYDRQRSWRQQLNPLTQGFAAIQIAWDAYCRSVLRSLIFKEALL